MPEFIADDPEMWLQLADKSFGLARITNEYTKLSYVVTALNQHVITDVRDIVMSPPAQNPYTALKSALISRMNASQEQKTRRLLEREEMGNSKPSQFLRRLKALAGSSVSQSLLRTLWLGGLLQNIQAILATQKSVKLEDVSELAGAIIESISPKTAVF